MRRTTVTVLAVLALVVAACGGDDGATVRQLDDGSGTGSGTGTGAASATGTGGAATEPGDSLGPYAPVSDVTAHAAVTLDICEINELLPGDGAIDYPAVSRLYSEGENSVNSDGSVRTLAGFASSERDEPIWNDYVAHFGDPVWLHSFVTSALDGAEAFAGEPDAVRRQGIQKGIQNQIMVAWTVHELVAALDKAATGDLDPASGAPHNWDEAWAFYHGAAPDCAPYATAERRGADFGTGNQVNEAIAAAMSRGRDALVKGDAATAEEAFDEVLSLITVTYLQASIKYATTMGQAVAAGDEEGARVQQAEGWSFWRVIEPLVAGVDAEAAATVTGYLELASPPREGAGEAVVSALEPTYAGLGVDPDQLGTFQG